MRALLRRPRFSAHSALGGGLPPGSDYENKPGSAYDTLQDVMYARLPSGRELVVSVFSNGWDPNEREPWDVARLGDFAQRLLHELHLEARGGASRLLEPRIATDDEMRWRWRNAAAGKYELAVWYDADAANTPRASARVEPLAADAASDVDQTTWGRRWIRLGDFDLPRGTNELVLTRRAAGRLAPTRLRITPWPDQH
jgi:hypothetical protein